MKFLYNSLVIKKKKLLLILVTKNTIQFYCIACSSLLNHYHDHQIDHFLKTVLSKNSRIGNLFGSNFQLFDVMPRSKASRFYPCAAKRISGH